MTPAGIDMNFCHLHDMTARIQDIDINTDVDREIDISIQTCRHTDIDVETETEMDIDTDIGNSWIHINIGKEMYIYLDLPGVFLFCLWVLVGSLQTARVQKRLPGTKPPVGSGMKPELGSRKAPNMPMTFLKARTSNPPTDPTKKDP